MDRRYGGIASAALAAMVLFAHGIGSAEARPRTCGGGALTPGQINGSDLVIKAPCTVGPGTYNVGQVNIVAGGTLTFTDPPSSGSTDFWAKSILVENGGALIAGSPAAPIGGQGGVVTIHLYGKDQGTSRGKGIACVTDPQCGVPAAVWSSNGAGKVALPGGVTDYFYQYDLLPYDDGDPAGFFGYKVLAVSYGGTLQLFGKKGVTYSSAEPPPSSSGTSWGRLNGTIQKGATSLVVDRQVDWQPGDRIVVTTTDYLPGHSELLQIQSVGTDLRTIAFTTVAPTCSDGGGGVCWAHNGEQYDLSMVPSRLGLEMTSAETRAAVALLTRSIRIVSGGDAFGDPFPAESSGYFFGGHTLVRQGAAAYQVQGVEFYQLGQGGRIAHYPVHMHMARLTPPNTFVKDSSVHDSMTRWYVLHATHGVTLARNVGYQSIGHGYYIEDGTEINNRLLSNIGIFARAAIANVQNPRDVPGILAQTPPAGDQFPYQSDYDHPSVFWIMNGWNDFEYNMATGAGTCGACYWLVPGWNSGPSASQTWESYAAMQSSMDRAATTPLKRFVGNYCSTAMNSFNTVGDTAPCHGVVDGSDPMLEPVPNPLSGSFGNYYPNVLPGGGRFATQCGDGLDCGKETEVHKCSAGIEDNCVITALDRYTSSFHWADTNYAAVWLRPQWYLVNDSVLTDVQNGGLTMVTGGGYTTADIIPGHWALVRKTAFVGNTQPGNPLASSGGPVNPQGLRCDGFRGSYCPLAAEGVSLQIGNFAVNQRLLNIYDGPMYQDSNAYLDIQTVHVDDCTTNGCISTSKWLAGNALGLPQDSQKQCYMPNAAIAWKQPNGFYYPPAFHSTNLFFHNVGIRHFVIEPLFLDGTYTTDGTATAKRYCNQNNMMFNGFTDIDRQTELSDDDGSLTGYVNTISVNLDPFFNAPVEATECASDAPTVTTGTAKTSPYDYVTSVVYPGCATSCTNWSVDCTGPSCYGVPLVRQLFTANEGASSRPTIRMAGQAVSQRSTLTANNGVYYIDTTLSQTTQSNAGFSNLNVFQASGQYYVFLLFAKPTTTQTYQLYVGTGYDPTKLDSVVWATQANVKAVPVQFKPSGQVAWPSTWTRSYNATTGVLTVTMDMLFYDFARLYETGRQDRCRPASFCTWDTSACVGTSAAKMDIPDADAVCAWAVKDVDCPDGGCFGFGVTMSSSFTYDVDQRPAPTAFPTTGPWNAQFVKAAPKLSGNCP